jgi:hypothetical protein
MTSRWNEADEATVIGVAQRVADEEHPHARHEAGRRLCAERVAKAIRAVLLVDRGLRPRHRVRISAERPPVTVLSPTPELLEPAQGVTVLGSREGAELREKDFLGLFERRPTPEPEPPRAEPPETEPAPLTDERVEELVQIAKEAWDATEMPFPAFGMATAREFYEAKRLHDEKRWRAAARAVAEAELDRVGIHHAAEPTDTEPTT